MPAPLPPDQLTIVRNLIAKGDTEGAIKVFAEATGASLEEARGEVNSLASRYGLVGSQLPDLFVRRTPAKPAPPASAPPPAPAAPPPPPPPAPAPVAQQAANVPLEPPAPAPAPAPVPPPPATPSKPAMPIPARTQSASSFSIPKGTASPQAVPRLSLEGSTPSPKKSKWGCSSVIVLVGAAGGIAWWALA